MNEKSKKEWEEIYIKKEIGGFKTKDPVAREWRKKCEHKRMDEVIKKYFPNKEKLSVLDVGCGDGNFAFYFAEKGYDVLAFDFSEHAIKENIEKNTYKNLEFQVCDVEKFETKKKFDLVFFGGVLIYLKDEIIQKNYLKFKKMTKKNGIIILREPTSLNEKCVKGISTYRKMDKYINLDKKNLIEKWRNECSIYHIAYSKLKKYKIEKLLNILKPLLDFRNEIIRKIKKKPKIEIYYYIFRGN